MSSQRESALAVSKLAHDTVTLRILAGHHPEDAMMQAWQIYEAWVRVEVDGAWPVYKTIPTAEQNLQPQEADRG